MNETVTTIVGNIISEVKQRRTQDGIRVVSFRVASNERRFDKAAGQWVDGDRLYVSVTCWRKLARGVGASLVKGDPVVVTGRLYTRGYEVEGQKRSITELEAVAVGPDLSRCLAELDRARREATEDAPAQDALEPASRDDARPVVGAEAAQDAASGVAAGTSEDGAQGDGPATAGPGTGASTGRPMELVGAGSR
jgi:single-strand DNA-binding protein